MFSMSLLGKKSKKKRKRNYYFLAIRRICDFVIRNYLITQLNLLLLYKIYTMCNYVDIDGDVHLHPEM